MCGDRDVSRPPASRRLVYGDTETDLSKAGVGIRRLDRRPVPERSQTHVPTDTKVPAHAKHQPNTSFAFTADSSHTEADGAEAEAPVDKEAWTDGWIKPQSRVKSAGAQPDAILRAVPASGAHAEQELLVDRAAGGETAAETIRVPIAV